MGLRRADGRAFEVLAYSVANLGNKEVKPRILRKELVIVL